jgi:hypothetical protein
MADMKTRNKAKAEKEYDQLQCLDAASDLCNAAESFINEFQDCDGNVYYSTFSTASRALWDLEHARRVAGCIKVGHEWDMENSITGKFRYPHLR